MLIKYFLDPQGIALGRMAGKPFSSHIPIAEAVLIAHGKFVPLAKNSDIYEQMFKLGYARVVEDDQNVWVDSPNPLTRAQRDFLEDKHYHQKKNIILNDKRFIEARAKNKPSS